MKVLSLTQPWATLVVYGLKQYETRSWRTNYTGPLAIHASKGFPRDCKELCDGWPFDEALASLGLTVKTLPVGCVVGTVILEACFRTDDVKAGISETEYEFGDYSSGRYAWQMSSPAAFRDPIPATGALQLWEWLAPKLIPIDRRFERGVELPEVVK